MSSSLRGRARLGALAATAVAGLLAGATGPGPAWGASPAAGAGAAVAQQTRPDFTLTVLHNNDGESQLLGVDADINGDGAIAAWEENSFGGIARFASLVEQERRIATAPTPRPGYADDRGVVLVSSGDNFLAGPEFAASLAKGVPFYDATAMKLIHYDAAAIGNHEFDFGPDVLAQFIESFEGTVPFVSANLDFSGEPSLAALTTDRRTLVKATFVRKAGEGIGIIGLTTPQLAGISSPRNVTASAELAEITNRIVGLFERRGVDKIVLLSHLQDIDEERALVPHIRGVDVVVGGGGGELLAKAADPLVPGDERIATYPLLERDAEGVVVPIVTTSGNYKYLGRLVVHFDAAGSVVGWDRPRSGPVRVSGRGVDAVPADPRVRFQVVRPVREFVAELDQTVVARTEVPLNGLRTDVRSRETNLGNLLADALRWAATERAEEFGTVVPQVAIQNGGGIRNDSILPAGPVTALDTFDVAPFSNFVCVLPAVPRETFRQLLERGVFALPEGGDGAFVHISGARVTYDVSRTAQVVDESTGEITVPGQRIVSVVLDDGTVVVADGEVVPGEPIAVATNDFSARGGDFYPLAGLEFTTVGLSYQQALEQYLEAGLGGVVTAADYPVDGEGRITPAES